MYSKELLMLDRNTVQYMVDEMNKKIERQKQEIALRDKEIEVLKAENARLHRQLELQA